MRYVSDAFARRLQDNSTLTAKATIAYADGTRQSLTGDDFCSVEVEQATSSSGSFDIGAAVVGQLTCTLNNYDDRFSEKDFEGAVLTMWVGTTLASGNEEWVKLGVFTVDRPDSYAGQINITALDNLSLMEGEFVSSKITWPASLQAIADKACTACGLINDTASIPNGSYIVKTAPDSDDLTWLDVVGYVAQATGTFCRATADGHVEFAWYDTTAHEKESDLDGGSFDSSSPYSTGDTADGGDFTDYGSGATLDGGTFADMRRIGQVNRYTSMTLFTDDVVITGVSVTAQNQVVKNEDGSESNGEDGETALYGSDGYVLSLEDNPLVLYGQAATVAAQVGERVVGMRFRPFSCDAVLDPSIEAGDAILVWDRKGNCYESYVTSMRISVNGSESIECSAESASRNSADKASAATKAVVKARNDLKREQTARELAQKDLQQKMENAAGLYSTSVKQSDGSYIYYLHDKSDLASSKIVWKMTADALAVSTAGPDGPYVTGLTADGTALLKRIYAIGIDADYINAGMISDRKGLNYWNLETGDAQMTAGCDNLMNGTGDFKALTGGRWASYGLAVQGTASLTHAKDATCPVPESDCVTIEVTKAGETQTGFCQGSYPYLRAGETYTFSCWAKSSRANTTVQAHVAWISGVGTVGNTVTTVGTSWTRVIARGTVTNAGSSVNNNIGQVTIRKPTAAGDKLYVCGIKLERGNTATPWRQKASDEVSALDDSLTQADVFNRLTNGGTSQGIYLNSGTLYINGTYIKTGTIDANLIKTGTITDTEGNNYWNLATGYIKTTNGSIGGFTISSDEIKNNVVSLKSNGLRLLRSSTDVGFIGTNVLTADSTKCGLTFDLNYSGAYMAWAAMDSSTAKSYSMKWTYANKTLPMSSGDSCASGKLHAGCDIDMHNWKIKNIGNGVNSKLTLTVLTNANSDGSFTYSNNCSLTFTDGLLTGFVWPNGHYT